MKKILIAIGNDFIRETYTEVLQKEGFSILKTNSGKEAKDLFNNQKLDLIILDIQLPEIGGFELLKEFKSQGDAEKIKTPIIIFDQFERKEERKKAMELEAQDFITASGITPIEIIQKVKIILGGQKTYRLSLQENKYDAKELAEDLGYDKNFKCSQCGAKIILHLIRDLSKGEDYFKISFICPKCLFINHKNL